MLSRCRNDLLPDWSVRSRLKNSHIRCVCGKANWILSWKDYLIPDYGGVYIYIYIYIYIGDPKIPGIIKRMYFKTFVKVWNVSPLQSTVPNDWMQRSQRLSHCWKRCLNSSTEMFSTALSNSRWASATSANRLPFGQKQNGVFTPTHTPNLPTAVLATFLCSQGRIRIWKVGVLLMWQRLNENRWRPTTAFPLTICGSGTGFTASGQWRQYFEDDWSFKLVWMF